MVSNDVVARDLSLTRKRTTTASLFWTCLLTAVVLSVVFSWHYLPFVADDALIAYRYSARFLDGHGLTWNDGEFVEGYSTLLWVLLVAVGGLFQSNLLLVGWALGILANVATLIAIGWTFRRSTETAFIPVLCGFLTLTFSAGFALWGVGGLETPLFAALVAWGLGASHRTPLSTGSWIYPALPLGLLSITRESNGTWWSKEDLKANPHLSWTSTITKVSLAAIFAYVLTHW